ncbi:hypothetical protein ACFQV2_32890 [Actinokineospora soli]|uniref:DUF4239 domain-containing protein n=1 Tax=Actinokineospora soli TaxID=1048753 RepID=A0ABW2TW00_9PSEU
MLITIAVAVAALVLGLLANWLVKRRRQVESGEPIMVSDLVSPMETLAVLLLAFVLVVAAESYSTADEAVRSEANIVDNFFEISEFAPPAAAQKLQAATVCYSRAVLSREWPSMEDGDGMSSAPSAWSTEFRTVFRQLGPEHPLFEILVEADRERSNARSERVMQSVPAIPDVLYWFMLLALAVTVATFAFSLPARGKKLEVTTLVVLTALFTLSLLLIRDVDRPFGGAISVSADTMRDTEADITEDFTTLYGANTLPCDQNGDRASGA